MKQSRGGTLLNTTSIERLNGTIRERLATLTRSRRYAARRLETLQTRMYLIGCTYNFCWTHHELSRGQDTWYACTPGMASGLTDHVWSIAELLCYRIAPPAWWNQNGEGVHGHVRTLSHKAEATTGTPSHTTRPDLSVPKRLRGRPRKITLSAFTS